MGKEKTVAGMSAEQIIETISEGNPEAKDIILNIVKDQERIMSVLNCDWLGIRGTKICILYNECCNKNNGKFDRTLELMKVGIFSEEEIDENFNLKQPIPFLEDDIRLIGENIPYEEHYMNYSKRWKEYCNVQKQFFAQKLLEAIRDGEER